MVEKRKKTKLAAPKKASATTRAARVSRGSGGYAVVGTTRDGVKVLRPKVKPTHFTTEEIREAISTVSKFGSRQ